MISLFVSLFVAQAAAVTRLDVVDATNKAGATWKAYVSVNDAVQEEGSSIIHKLGVKGDHIKHIQALVDAGEIDAVDAAAPGFKAPDSFDSETNWPQCAKVIGDIRDQSNCGCCWAFGGASAASDRACIATNASIAVPFSAEEVCFRGNYPGCDGGQITIPWADIARDGVVTGGNQGDTGPLGGGWCSKFSLPHCHHHGPQGNDPYPDENSPGCPATKQSPPAPKACDSDAKAPHNVFASDKYTFEGRVTTYRGVSAIQEAIMNDGPVETAFTVYSDFENYAGGIYKHTGGSMLGGHAVRIVGWGTENGQAYWKVANSWNPFWGEKGYFRIALGSDECGIESGTTASPKGAKWSKMS